MNSTRDAIRFTSVVALMLVVGSVPSAGCFRAAAPRGMMVQRVTDAEIARPPERVVELRVRADLYPFAPGDPDNRLELGPGERLMFNQTAGTWVWNPSLGPCGPGGVGLSSALRGMVVPAYPGGTLAAKTSDGTFVRYEPRLDLNRGGRDCLENTSSDRVTLWFFCNDVNAADAYRDNSGEIRATVRVLPPRAAGAGG